MLGLRPENDQGYYQSIQRTTPQFKKSGKFANQLTGRFFVSGISGSFAKHQKHLHEIKEHEIAQLNPPIESDQLLEDNPNNTNNNNNNNNNEENNKPSVIPIRFLPHKKLVRKYTYQPVLEKRQREELRKDAQRLLELEEKLNEIQRIKSLKRQRDRQRRKRKAKYLAATTIQKTFRGYSVRSKQQAVDVLTDFLRSVQANQAIVKFLAALGIVKKFMKKKFPAWQKKHFLRKQAKEVAEDNWLIVTEVASILTAARREVTRDFLDTVFEIGTENVMPQLIEEEKKRRELLKKKQSKKKKGKGMKKPEDFLQFFLTEFDRNADGTASDEDDDDEDDGDEEERSLEELEQDYQAFQRFTATLRSQPYSLNKAPSSSNINLHQSSRYLAAFPPHFQPQSKKKQYDLNDAKTQQLIQRHQQLVNKMEEEQQRRQTLLEKKRSSLTYDQQKKLEEEKKKHQKKKLKEEFLKKLEDEASRRQQFQQRLREVKERKAAEAASQQRETQLMGKEDVLMIQKKLREVQLQRERIFATSNNVNNNNTKKPKSATRNKVVVTESSQPTKKAAVPKVPHRPVETNKKPSEEKIMAAVMRVAVSEEEKARYTELLSKRIKEAKQQKLLEKQQQEVEEQEKKEKLEKFLQKYQEQLKEQKIAMKLKKKEEKRLKKLQKEKERREAGETGEGGDEEKDNDNDQEEGEGELLAHVISSAPEEFKNIMEDFQFDDFMEKPDLIQIYSEDSPKHDLQAFPTEIIPSLPSPGVIDYKQSNHFQASSNIAQPATSLPPQQKKKVVTSKTKANKPADATSEQSIKRFYKINRDIFRMPRHLKSTPYYQHYVKYVKETENIPIDQILSREGGERDKDKDEKEKKRGGEKIAHASPRKELSQSKIKEVVNEVEVQGEEEEEQYGLLEMIQRAQEKKYGAANLPRQQQTVSQSNNTNNTQPQPTQTTQGTTIHKAISQPSLPTISDQKPVIPSSDMAMKHSSSTNQVTSALTVKAPVLKFTHNLPVPTIPTLNSLLTPHHTSSNLPQPTSEAFPLQSLPAPPLETMLNIKQRYGISIDDFATHLPNTTSNTMTAAGNHVSTIKKLKMKKLKAEKEQQTVVKNESNKMKKKENNKEENKKKKTKTSAASPNTLIIPLPRQKKPTRKEITMEGVMEVEGEEEEEGEGHSLAYSHDTLSVNIPSRQRKLSKRYSTPLAPLSSAINTNPATTTTSASSKKKRKESFPTSEEKGAVGAIKKELQEEQSKVKQKISELFDYEQQLQKDYADLKKQFQEKLQHAMMTSSSKGRGDDEEEEMEGGRLEVEVDEEGEVGEESSDSLIMMKGGRQEEVEREDDIMRKSITESYSEQVSNKMMSSSQPKVSTKDLLMEWAIEDAIEKGEINDDDLIALHQQKQLKYSEQGDDDDDDEEEEEEEDYEEEEERGEVDHEGGEAEGEDYEDEAEEGEEKDMPSEYDDDSYYDRRLNSLRGTSNNPSKPPTALSLSQHPIHEEEGEEDNELDEEEGSFDEDEDEEEYMRDERKEYWKQLLSLDQTATTSSSDKNNNNVSAQTTTQTQLDDYCLSMMNNLNAKISQK